MTEEVKIPAFVTSDFGVASFKTTDYRLNLTEAHSMGDVENPRLWKLILGKIVRGDTVQAFKADSGEFAKFVVTEVGPGFIKLGKIEGFVPAEVIVPEGPLETKWNVGKRTFDVIRSADKYVMAGGFQTKASAVVWIEDHQKKVAA